MLGECTSTRGLNIPFLLVDAQEDVLYFREISYSRWVSVELEYSGVALCVRDAMTRRTDETEGRQHKSESFVGLTSIIYLAGPRCAMNKSIGLQRL